MKAAADCVVRFNYRLRDSDGQQLESSFEREPIAALLGRQGLVPGVEKALQGREAGARFDVDVPAAEGYGLRDERMRQRIPKKHFGDHRGLEVGARVVMQSKQGSRVALVEKIGHSVVDLDFNHPLAGQDLAFEIEVVEVRAATAEEKAHGHVHGEGGHDHGDSAADADRSEPSSETAADADGDASPG